MSPKAGGTSVEDCTFSDRKSASHVVIQYVLDTVPSEIAGTVHYPISA